MEHPFSSKEKGNEYWSPSRAQVDGGTRSVVPEDIFSSFSELLSFDSFPGWYNSPAVTDPVSAAYGLSSLPSVAHAPLDAPNMIEESLGLLPGTEVGGNFNLVRNSHNFGDKIVFQPVDTQFEGSTHPNAPNVSVTKLNSAPFQGNGEMDIVNMYGPTRCSLDEKMLRALSFVKESSGGGILAQVWVPLKRGDQLFLSTSEQPYLLDHNLAGYREVSRMYTFSAEENSGGVLGLPGRVFVSKVPEWTSNVGYYQKNEYVRVEHAFSHQVRGSIALPVFERDPTMPCCAVLELVTTKEKANFDTEMEIVCHALQVCFHSICTWKKLFSFSFYPNFCLPLAFGHCFYKQ